MSVTARTTASPISRMLPESWPERQDTHQRPGVDEHRGAGHTRYWITSSARASGDGGIVRPRPWRS